MKLSIILSFRIFNVSIRFIRNINDNSNVSESVNSMKEREE